MAQTGEEFFHDFRQELLAGAEANGRFQLDEFMETVASELVETGFTEGFELCHYRAQRGMRVDGYWFNDEGILDLFIADFDSRNELISLTGTEVTATFKRVANFFDACVNKGLACEMEVTTPEYGLAKQIEDRQKSICSLNLILVSERTLSGKVQNIPDGEVAGVSVRYHIWDISRLLRLRSSLGHKEALDLDFTEMFGQGIPCLPVHTGINAYQAYLMVVPAEMLSALYGKYGARLLEQNVRTFLQARGNVNKGIRATILNEPRMFFAYNNGLTATAQTVETEMTDVGLTITRIVDLQIVNGGQTTASLFHTQKRDKADLSQIFVQMKMTVIDNQQNETVIPRISEYANTQNRVNAADFFSNHPFHVRMEDFSRRIWAPAQRGAIRETKWFYERARGQYADVQLKMTPADLRRFKIENPKAQMFTKTDLAKFENVWDEHPRWVNLGAQKNFSQYAARIGKEWEKSPDPFNELYFKRAITRGIIFRATEQVVSAQPWYNGGYRANIVVYTLAILGEITKRQKVCIDYLSIWNTQEIDSTLKEAITIVAKEVNSDITSPPQGISNVTEWCKREACWTRMQARVDIIAQSLPASFFKKMVTSIDQLMLDRDARKTQQIDNGIQLQQKVLSIPAEKWASVHEYLHERKLLTTKEEDLLRIAMRMPNRIPTDKQCVVLLDILEKGRLEGIDIHEPIR